MRTILVILALLCLLVSSCAENVEEDVECSSSGYNEITGAQLEEWESIILETLTRFPGNLTPVISDLEKILGEYKNLDIPRCYHPAHDKFMAGMDYALAGVKEYEETGAVTDKFDLADAEFAAAEEELMKLDE